MAGRTDDAEEFDEIGRDLAVLADRALLDLPVEGMGRILAKHGAKPLCLCESLFMGTSGRQTGLRNLGA